MAHFQTPLRDDSISNMVYLCDDTTSEKNEEQHISFFFSVCQWQRCKDSIQDLKLRCYLVLIERPGLIATKDGMSSISMEQIQNDITNTLNWQHKVYSLEIGLEMKNARWDSHVTPLNSQSHT